MHTDRTIPTDDRLWHWFVVQVSRTQQGSIHFEIEQGKIRSIACHGHRFLYTSDELQEPNHDA